MALKDVMNASGMLGHQTTPPSLISGGVFVITSLPSTKAFAPSMGGGIHLDSLKYIFSGGSAAGFVPGSVATVTPQEILATSLMVTVEGKAVMRAGDFGSMACIGTISPTPTPPAPPTGPVSGVVVVSNAGQGKFSAQ